MPLPHDDSYWPSDEASRDSFDDKPFRHPRIEDPFDDGPWRIELDIPQRQADDEPGH